MTNDTGTPANPNADGTLLNNAWLQDIYDRIDAMFDGSPGFDFGGVVTIPTKLYFNDTANAKQTIGITINQGANDDEAIALKSSDVAHGMTDLAETDTYGMLRKADFTAGGVGLHGFSETAIGVRVHARVGSEIDTKSADVEGAVTLNCTRASGTADQNMSANTNLLVVRYGDSGSVTRFILDSDGDSHQDVGTAWTNFDDYDDLALLDGLSAALASPDDALRQQFGGWLAEHQPMLQQLKLVTFNADGHHFANWSRFHMLEVGAIRQVGRQLATLQAQLHAALDRIAVLEAAA
jgi:hypothetical protein